MHHPGGAAIAAVDEAQRLWRPAAGSGRYRLEEAGIMAASWTSLGATVTSPGVCDELVHLFLARELTRVVPCPESHELIEVHWVPLREALQRANTGDVNDAKTVIALFRGWETLRAWPLEHGVHTDRDRGPPARCGVSPAVDDRQAAATVLLQDGISTRPLQDRTRGVR